MKIRYFLAAVGCAVLLSGCTQSNIVHTDGLTKVMGGDPELETDLGTVVEIDLDALTEEVNDLILDPEEYPMAANIRFSAKLDEGIVDIDVVVKDDTSDEDAAWYAGEAIKALNDAVTVQDSSYAVSSETYFGGLYQDATINVKLYYKSDFPNGEPFFEDSVEPDTYKEFEIQ
jgi:hypothetical protein